VADLKFLVAKLNGTCRAAAESAAAQAVARAHDEVDVCHLLAGLLHSRCADMQAIAPVCGLDLSALSSDVREALVKCGGVTGSKTPMLSDDLIQLLQSAWARSVEFNFSEIRSGSFVLALAEWERLPQFAERVSPELAKLNKTFLRGHLTALFSAGEGGFAGASQEAVSDGQSALALYTIDLTGAARAGALDPVIGRDSEIRQLIEILARRRQNNPILTGDPGVGKTAVVEGLALRIAAGDVPPLLATVSVRTLDLGLLAAGASARGELEARLKGLMKEVQTSHQPIVLFVDEAHTLVGGQPEAANLLKPALARGELRMIAATTYVEYRKYFESDAALARRFQMVAVNEPTEQQAIQMLRGLTAQLEKHHGVRILGEAVRACVELSHRYITGRQLPDKAIGILDTACARVASAQNATPPPIDLCRQNIAVLESEIRELERERMAGVDAGFALDGLFERLGVLEMQLANLEDRCEEERSLVQQAITVRAALEASGGDGASGEAQEKLAAITSALAAVQGDEPLVPAFVDGRVVGEVISEVTGIPLRRMLDSELRTVLNLRMQLEERVVGQTHALDAIAKRVLSARAGLDDPRRPTGVFLLAGPSGVGKTETAMALAEILFGGEKNAVVLNMSEFQEAHSISGLKGSPPGYVGYGEGGVLTEAVRRRPYCLLLLDEMEKAHADVMELFYQVFDKGVLEDAQGRVVDFRNTLIILTSNVGADVVERLCAGGSQPGTNELREVMGPELRRVFAPALLGRMTVVPYFPVTDEMRRRIVELKLGEIRERLRSSHGIEFQFAPPVVESIAELCRDSHSGAREIDHFLTGTLIPEISEKVLYASATHKPIAEIRVGLGASGEFRYETD
jgi:type VI secretion system protein VasG